MSTRKENGGFETENKFCNRIPVVYATVITNIFTLLISFDSFFFFCIYQWGCFLIPLNKFHSLINPPKIQQQLPPRVIM